MTHCSPGNPKMTTRQAIGLGTVLVVVVVGYVLIASSSIARDQSPDALDQRIRAEANETFRVGERLQKQIDELRQRVEKLETRP